MRNPVLHRKLQNAFEVPYVSGNHRQSAGERNGGYSEVGVADRRSSAFEQRPNFAVMLGRCGVKGENRQVGDQLVDLVQQLG